MSQKRIKTMNKVKNPSKSKVKESGKVIRNKLAYKRYQIDLVELLRELNMNKKFKYQLTWVDNFSKYAWVLPIKN